jgi:electron transport complex protein RnfB
LFFITDKCIGCTACLKICPVEAIAGERSVIHTIDSTCIDCGACGRVCPVDAIEDQYGILQPHVKRAEWPKPVIIAENCTGCNYCVDVCPEKCLDVVPNAEFPGVIGIAEFVNPKTCIGCRLCEDVCAKNAIIMSDTLALRGVA